MDTVISGANNNDRFGQVVALSSDQSVMAVGSPYNDNNGQDAGLVNVFERRSGKWQSRGSVILGDSAGDYFGYSVDLSGTGDTLIVGAIGSDVQGDSCGSVKTFRFNGTSYVQVGRTLYGTNQKDGFGHSVSINKQGNLILIGAPWAENNSAPQAGKAYLYALDSGQWDQPDTFWFGGDYYWFGYKVALAGNANPNDPASILFAVSTPRNSNYKVIERGMVKAFYYRNSRYYSQDLYWYSQPYEHSGESMDISDDGYRIAAGAPGYGVGKVDIWDREYSYGYKHVAQLSGHDTAAPIGGSLCLSGNGKFLSLSTPDTSTLATVKTYRYHNKNGWVLAGDSLVGDTTNQSFGVGLSLDYSGKALAIGASKMLSGSASKGSIVTYAFNGLQNSISNPDTVAFSSYCDPYETSSGLLLDTSGWYLDTLISASGCDRVSWINFTRYRDSVTPVAKARNYNIVLDSFGRAGLSASLLNWGSTDNCGIDTMYLSQDSVDCSDIDNLELYLYVVDQAGNMDSVRVPLTIYDVTAPVTMSRDVTLYLDSNGKAAVNLDSADIGTYDNCELTSLYAQINNYTCKDLGPNQNYLLGVDDAGNIGVSPFRVIVIDSTLKIDSVDVLTCDHFASSGGTYVEESTSFYDTIPSANGCDSIVYYDVKLTNRLVIDSISLQPTRSHVQMGDGLSFGLNGSRLAVGHSFDTGPSSGIQHGAVKVMQRSGKQWSQVGQTIYGEKGFDHIGSVLSLSGNGTTVAIGTIDNDDGGTNAGQVQVYGFSSGSWKQMGSDIEGTTGDYCGNSVDLSKSGQILAVGSPRRTVSSKTFAGVVRVYEYKGGSWTQMGATLEGGAAQDQFGWSVAISSDGKTLAVGSPGNSDRGTSSGQVQVYKFNSGSWSQVGSDMEGLGSNQTTGLSLDLSADGSTVVFSEGAQHNKFNRVKVMKFVGGKWTQIGSNIDRPSKADRFGRSLACSDDATRLIIGASYDGSKAYRAGKLYVYHLVANQWQLLPIDHSVGDTSNSTLGTAVDISSDGKTFAGGGPSTLLSNGNSGGMVKIFNQYPVVSHEPDTVYHHLCNGRFVSPRGYEYTQRGYYTEQYKSALGCDSIVTVAITDSVTRRVKTDTTVCGQFITPNGMVIDSSGLYKEFVAASGDSCDTELWYFVTVNHNDSAKITETACDTYTSGSGKVWTSSGTYYDTLITQHGCDSFNTIDLTVNNSEEVSIFPTACNRYVSPLNNIYTESGIYEELLTTTAGCDSTIEINLTINSNSADTIFTTDCDSFTMATGRIYDQSGIYTEVIPNDHGCDSIINLFLTVRKSSGSEQAHEVCTPFISATGKIWKESGVYFDTLINTQGCDSIIKYRITYNGLGDIRHPVDVESGVGNNVGFSVDASNATKYRWQISTGKDYINLSNSSKYNGVTTDTLSVLNIESDDHLNLFRCIVSNAHCLDSSNRGQILVSLGIETVSRGVKVYPNPTSGLLNVDVPPDLINTDYSLWDARGKEVIKGPIGGLHTEIDLSGFADGIYTLHLNRNQIIIKIIYHGN